MSQHHHHAFSIEFLEHIVRHFNGVVKAHFIEISMNKIEIKFPRTQNANKGVVISLFTKLVEAFRIIREKYLVHDDDHTQLHMDIEDTETHFIIKIIGVMYIPPGKILNLLSLILWYYIRYKTGTKPANSDYGQSLNKEWKEEEEHLRYEINRSPRKLMVTHEAAPCFLCGEEAYGLNEWSFKPRNNARSIEMQTRVCKKHRSKLI